MAFLSHRLGAKRRNCFLSAFYRFLSLMLDERNDPLRNEKLGTSAMGAWQSAADKTYSSPLSSLKDSDRKRWQKR